METTYLVCAAVGGTLIACQFVMTLLGMGGHHDLAGDHSADAGGAAESHGDHGVDHGDESTWFLGLLTIRTLTAGLAFFGLVGLIGLRADLDPVVALGLAILAGVSALLGVSWLMRMLVKLNIDGTVRIEHALGCPGTVYVSIPGKNEGKGKAQISVRNRTVEYTAITASSPLAPGTKIVVVAIVGADTVEVAPSDLNK